jgi:hypothetical protein
VSAQRISRIELRAYLAAQTEDALLDLLLQAVDGDVRFGDRLRMAAATDGSRATRLATFRSSIDGAVLTDGFVSWEEAWDYAAGVDDAIDGLDRLLAEGHADDVIELAEYALSAVEGAIEDVDDSSGHLGGILDRLQELHLKACRRAKPDQRALAERLFARELNGEWDTFTGAFQTHGRVLGKAGRTRYRELAEATWADVPPRGPTDEPRHDRWRETIARIMESLSRNVDELVEVMARDLARGRQFLRIAKAYRAAGRDDDALAWAERGVLSFATSPDEKLVGFLADEHARRGDHSEATRLMWDAYAREPCLDTYGELKERAEPAGEWVERREHALKLLRAQLVRKVKEPTRRYPGWQAPDHSELVRIFLWEGDTDAAWQEAQTGGCSAELWLQLAQRRREHNPADALQVSQTQVDPTIERKNNDAYQEAIRHVREIQALLSSLGREEEFPIYVADLRARHHRKRNLVKLIDEL